MALELEARDKTQGNWFLFLGLPELFHGTAHDLNKILKFATNFGCISFLNVDGSNTCLPHSCCIKFSDV